MYFVYSLLMILAAICGGQTASAKGSNELSSGFSYLTARADSEDNGAVKSTHLVLNLSYLRNIKSYWAGGELTYDSYSSDSTSTLTMILGGPLKYWFKGPESKGVGFYLYTTPYLGRADSQEGSGTVFGLKLGPGLGVFLSDLLSIDIKLVYDYRKTSGRTSTTTGLTTGFAIYF